MPRQDPRTHSDPWSGHPEPVGLNRAPASTPVPGHGQAPPSSSCPVEKGMTKARPEHVASDPAVEAVMEPGGSKGARQLGDTSADSLARARPRLGMSKVAAWHGQGIPWQGLTNLDLGVDPGDVVSPRGDMGTVKDDPRACLGHHAKATHGPVTPSRWDSTEPRLAPRCTGTAEHHRALLSVEKHGPRPLRRGETGSRTGVLVGYVTTYWLFYKARGSRLGEA
ncbi:hypothetical protein Scep_007414 [Stephania cephalantha]|uniref:Uncharacterized protein n=1 Tax=Stephania cephalantha TaxID=152367 RepID=A0AAP0PLS2_9MAGN